MSISLILSGLGAVVAAVGVGLLMARSFRAPRGDLICWSVALLGLLISLGAQALGHLLGFSQLSFRAMEIGAQLIAPLALIMGLAEVMGTSLAARFASRLFVPSLGLVALVILGTDPLSGVAFTKGWPSPAVYYQLIPNKLVEYGLAPVSLIVAACVVIVALVRSGRSREWRAVTLPVVAAGVAVLALAIPGVEPALSNHLGLSLPLSSLFAVLCLLAAVLTWYAGVKVDRVPIGLLHGAGSGAGAAGAGRSAGRDRYDARDDARDEDGWGRDQQWRGADHTGDFDSFDDGSQGVYRGGGLYRDEPPHSRNGAGRGPGDDSRYGWAGQPGYPAEGYPAGGAADYDSRELDAAYAGYDTGSRDGYDTAGGYDTGVHDDYPPAAAANGLGGQAAAGPPGVAGGPGTASALDGPGGLAGPGGYGPAGEPPARGKATREQLFGQIAIYTLIEDRVRDFDRLAERVVGQVRSGEPDTLVFIVHAVPSAPMQRILYEVYRDRAAYDWHRQQSYVAQFEVDRRPQVLATNVIELGLQQAKVSPFPSIADLFGEPGYDTSGFERPDYTREYGTSAGQGGPAI